MRRTIKFEGFANDKHRPLLADETGRAYDFSRTAKRCVPNRGNAKFIPMDGSTEFELVPLKTPSQDLQLIFAPSPPQGDNFEALKFEVPCSAWGRKGTCKFRIASLFDSRFPDKDQ